MCAFLVCVCDTHSQFLNTGEDGGQHGLDLGGGTRANHRVSLHLELLCDILRAHRQFGEKRHPRWWPRASHSGSYLALPVSAVHQDQALWERRVGQQNLVQLVIHHFPQELRTHTYTHIQVHKPPSSNMFTLQMTHQHIHNSFLSSYQDAFFILGRDKRGAGGGGRNKGSDCGNPSVGKLIRNMPSS